MRAEPTQLPAIPVLRSGDADLLVVISALTESMEVLLNRRGDSNDRAVTVRDLITAGMVKELVDGLPVNATLADPNTIGFFDPRVPQSLTQPPPPTNVVVSSTWHNAFIVFDTPFYFGHAFAEVWRSNNSTLANASLIGVTSGTLYRDGITSGTDYWYWVRFVNVGNPSQFGPWANDSVGTAITTSMDPADVIADLAGLISESEFITSLNDRIDLIDVTDDGLISGTFVKLSSGRVTGFGLINESSSTSFVILADKFAVALPSIQSGASLYPFVIALVDGVSTIAMDASVFIKDLSVTKVAIADATIDSAKIALLAVEEGHITEGSVTNLKIGDIIQSSNWNSGTKAGWLIDKEGNIQASSIIIYDGDGNVIMNSGGLGGVIPYANLNGVDLLNGETLWSQVAGTANAPADDADVTLDELSGLGINVLPLHLSLFDPGNRSYTASGGADIVEHSPTSAFFGAQSLKIHVTGTGDGYAWLGLNDTDYNIDISPSIKWIFSCWIMNAEKASSPMQFRIKTSVSGTTYTINETTHATPGTWKRVSGVLDLTSDASTLMIMRLDNDSADASTLFIDGIMLEEQVGTQAAPSSFNVTGPTRIDLSNISTYVGDLAVDSLQIADQAVTIPTHTFADEATAAIGDTWTEVQTLTYTSSGAPVKVDFSCQIGSSGAGLGIATFRILLDSVEKFAMAPCIMDASSVNLLGAASFTFKLTPAAGSRTISIEFKQTTGGTSWCADRSLYAVETLK